MTSIAFGGDLVIAELLRLDVAQAGDHFVAERAGGEGAVRLDQRHLQFRIEPPQRPRAAGAAKAAADHDDARRADCANARRGNASDAAAAAMPRTTVLRVGAAQRVHAT